MSLLHITQSWRKSAWKMARKVTTNAAVRTTAISECSTNQKLSWLCSTNDRPGHIQVSWMWRVNVAFILLSGRIIPAVDNQRISTMQTSFSNSNDAWRLWIRINQPGFSDKNYAGGNQFILKEKRYPFSQTGGLFTALSEKYQDCSVYMEGTQPAIHVYHIL